MPLTVERIPHPKEKPADHTLGFGKYFTDHMFLMKHDSAGWQEGKIVPYGPFSLDPSTMVFHYGQTVFEGLKAYRTADDRILLFRPSDNFARLNLSCRRLCIPEIDEEYSLAALKQLIALEQDWVPHAPNTSLYIRPFIFATDPYVGVRTSTNYIYNIILSPVGAYYAEGLKPVKIYVEDKYVRAVRGGMGYTKTAGNYAASLLAGEIANKKGFDQVLWLDGISQQNVEEVGSMNIFFKFNDELATPALNGSILGGITRSSIIQLAKDLGLRVNERTIPIKEVFERAKSGELEEVFGSGTAAVVSPVSALYMEGETVTIGNGQMGDLTMTLYDTLTGIQWGRLPDKYGWIVEIER